MAANIYFDNGIPSGMTEVMVNGTKTSTVRVESSSLVVDGDGSVYTCLTIPLEQDQSIIDFNIDLEVFDSVYSGIAGSSLPHFGVGGLDSSLKPTVLMWISDFMGSWIRTAAIESTVNGWIENPVHTLDQYVSFGVGDRKTLRFVVDNGIGYLYVDGLLSMTAELPAPYVPAIITLNAGIKVHSVIDNGFVLTSDLFKSIKTIPTFSNKETRAQANPALENLQYLPKVIKETLATRTGAYNSIFNQQGEQRKTGYYQSTVTVSDVPKPNTRVLCFTNDGKLLDETYSNESGVYRFDHLLMEDKYLFVAQYNNGNPKIAPDYLAAAADWQTPTPYGS